MTSPARSRWAVLGAFAAVGGATQLLWLAYAPITTDAARHYGVSESAIGWLANVFPLWYVLLALPAGALLDRVFGPALTAGAVLTAAGGVVRLLADDYLAALVGQTLVAIAQPLVLNAITAVAARYLMPADRPRGIAAASASTFAGMVLAFVLSAALPLRTMLLVSAVLAVAAAVVLVVALRVPAPFAAPPVPDGRAALRTCWRDRGIRRLCLLVLLPFGVFTALTTWAEALLDPAGISSGQAGAMLVANIVAGVLGSALLPVWAARYERQIPLMATGVLVTAAACVVLAVAPGLAVGIVVFAASGFVLLPALPVVLELTEQRAGNAAATASGLVWLAGQLGALAVTGAIGTLVDHPLPAFLALAAVSLLALPLLRGIPCLLH